VAEQETRGAQTTALEVIHGQRLPFLLTAAAEPRLSRDSLSEKSNSFKYVSPAFWEKARCAEGIVQVIPSAEAADNDVARLTGSIIVEGHDIMVRDEPSCFLGTLSGCVTTFSIFINVVAEK
jgi:hypothetical protein